MPNQTEEHPKLPVACESAQIVGAAPVRVRVQPLGRQACRSLVGVQALDGLADIEGPMKTVFLGNKRALNAAFVSSDGVQTLSHESSPEFGL